MKVIVVEFRARIEASSLTGPLVRFSLAEYQVKARSKANDNKRNPHDEMRRLSHYHSTTDEKCSHKSAPISTKTQSLPNNQHKYNEMYTDIRLPSNSVLLTCTSDLSKS